MKPSTGILRSINSMLLVTSSPTDIRHNVAKNTNLASLGYYEYASKIYGMTVAQAALQTLSQSSYQTLQNNRTAFTHNSNQ